LSLLLSRSFPCIFPILNSVLLKASRKKVFSPLFHEENILKLIAISKDSFIFAPPKKIGVRVIVVKAGIYRGIFSGNSVFPDSLKIVNKEVLNASNRDLCFIN